MHIDNDGDRYPDITCRFEFIRELTNTTVFFTAPDRRAAAGHRDPAEPVAGPVRRARWRPGRLPTGWRVDDDTWGRRRAAASCSTWAATVAR
ncbi:hypothetical protein [Micromonospora yasonensis]|uniref:hypothetical protein n=1 Tax=Micromonospora yasonensis TaxID=1128667 RepID=UPI003873C095